MYTMCPNGCHHYSFMATPELGHWYGGAAWLKDALSDDRGAGRLLMPTGMFFVVIGGWFLSR